jgi:hypothetical protein
VAKESGDGVGGGARGDNLKGPKHEIFVANVGICSTSSFDGSFTANCYLP